MKLLVNKPFLPPIELYHRYLEKIWHNQWLTNEGPLSKEFESKIKLFLDVPFLNFVTNGTQALQLCIRALELKGEIITTPFTHIATASSIVWEGCTPVMVDICPETWAIDATQIEAAITDKTSAILAVHIFGVPCHTEMIEMIAKRHGLKVIYDAAHAFGTNYQGRSILSYGDMAACSFHATKILHSIEGGAVISHDPEIYHKIQLMKNFGQSSAHEIESLGINAKNSEFHAAMGLCALEYFHKILAQRKLLYRHYLDRLSGQPLQFQKIPEGTEYNHAYFPVLFESEAALLRALKSLNGRDIYPRRYFYPSLSKVSYLNQGPVPIAEDISRRILCLPLYHDLTTEDVKRVCSLLKY